MNADKYQQVFAQHLPLRMHIQQNFGKQSAHFCLLTQIFRKMKMRSEWIHMIASNIL